MEWYAWKLGLDKIWFEGIPFYFSKRTTFVTIIDYSTLTNNKNIAIVENIKIKSHI